MGFAGAFDSERSKEGIMTQPFYDSPFRSADEMPDWSRPGMDRYEEMKERSQKLREADDSYSNIQNEDSSDEKSSVNENQRAVGEIGLADGDDEDEDEDEDEAIAGVGGVLEEGDDKDQGLFGLINKS